MPYSYTGGGVFVPASTGPLVSYSGVQTVTTAADRVAYSAVQTVTTAVAGGSPVPNPPVSLVAVLATSTRIDLSWTDQSSDETGFSLERSVNGGGFTQRAVLAANITSYQDSGLSSNTTYQYRVRAFNVAGNSTYSNTAQATTPGLSAPLPPSGLRAVPVSPNRVDLQWDDNAGNEATFQLERSTAGSGGPFTLIATTSADRVTYTDASVAQTTNYWYRVRAVNGIGNSPYSTTVLATTPAIPLIPTINETEGNVLLSVLVDWDNDGDFEDAGEDVSGDVLLNAPMQSVRGRDQLRALQPPMAGSATATVDNEERTYSPKNATGPLYGLLLPGRRVRHLAERPDTTDPYSSVVLADNPSVYLRLGETSGTTANDSSGNGRHGTYRAGSTLNQPGALNADANGSYLNPGNNTGGVIIPANAAFNTDGYTYEFWLYITDWGTQTLHRTILFKGQASTGGSPYGHTRNIWVGLNNNPNGDMHFSFFTGNGSAGTTVTNGPLATSRFGLRRWYHIVVVHRPGADFRFYLNGEIDRVFPTPDVADTDNSPIYLGWHGGWTTPDPWGAITGRLDEFARYPVALSDARIREHYLAGQAGRVSLFTGNLDDVPQQPAFGEHTATLPALGSLARLKGVAVSTGLYQNIRIDVALNILLDAAGWPASDRRIAQGNTTLLWWWLDDRDAFEAAVELMNTEGPGAYFGEDGDGNIVFEGRYHRLTNSRALLPQAVFLENGQQPYRLDRMDYNPGLKGVVNACTVETRRRIATGIEVVWTLGSSFTLGPNEFRIFTAAAGDGSPLTNAQLPMNGVDYTTVSGTVASTVLFRTSGGNITFRMDATAAGASISGLQLRAQRLAVSSTTRVSERVDTTTSRGRYGRRNFALQVWPEMDDLVAQDFCDAIVNAYQEPRATMSLWLPADIGGLTADRALYLRPSDRIAVYDTQTGLAGEAFVEQVEYTNQGNQFLVRLGCEEVSSAASNYLVWDLGAWDEDRWSY